MTTAFMIRSIAQNGSTGTAVVLFLSLILGLALGFAAPPELHVSRGWAYVSGILGWSSFGCWMIGWYPQILTNWHYKSVVGLSFDNAIYNWIGFFCYSIFNCALFFSKCVQEEYRFEHHGSDSGVRLNDVVFSLHASIMTTIGLFQICAYERGVQKVTRTCWAIAALIFFILLGFGVPLVLCIVADTRFLCYWNPGVLGFLYILSYVKLVMTLIKYLPQLVLNFERKSTVGWNITNALTDLAGGLLSLSQQVLDAIVMDDASIITGNLAKLGLGLISITYCLLLMFQHYVLYPTRDSALQKFTPLHAGEESASGLLQVNEV